MFTEHFGEGTRAQGLFYNKIPICSSWMLISCSLGNLGYRRPDNIYFGGKAALLKYGQCQILDGDGEESHGL